MENKVSCRERSWSSSRFEPELSVGLAKNLDTLRHDANHSMEDQNAIETEADERFILQADCLWRVEADMATEPENIQPRTTRFSPLKVERTKTYRNIQHIEGEESSSEEDCDEY